MKYSISIRLLLPLFPALEKNKIRWKCPMRTFSFNILNVSVHAIELFDSKFNSFFHLKSLRFVVLSRSIGIV